MADDNPEGVTPKMVLGVPKLPPALASEAGARLRSLLARIDRSIAPPPVQILESALANLEHRVLVALCDVGVPDALTGPTSLEDLAAAVGADVANLEKLVRFAAAKGWLRIDRHGHVMPNRVTEFLQSDHPSGWRSWVDFMSGTEVTAAIEVLGAAGGYDGFAEANGQPFFEWMKANPDRWAVFDRAMAAGARMHGLTLDAAIDWNEVSSICDVGGGTGEAVRVLLDRHSDWNGCVFDLPEVVQRAVEHPRMTAIDGDVFESVPSGYDAYLLINVLHDWDDESCVRILSNTRDAGGPDARILVVEANRRTVPRDDLALRADVLMAALTAGGKERSEDEFAALGRGAGLELVKTTPLVSGDFAYEFRTQ